MSNLTDRERALIDAAVYGPMAIMGAIGKQAPPWMRMISLGIGVGIMARGLFTYMDHAQKESPQLSGLGCGNCGCRNCSKP